MAVLLAVCRKPPIDPRVDTHDTKQQTALSQTPSMSKITPTLPSCVVYPRHNVTQLGTWARHIRLASRQNIIYENALPRNKHVVKHLTGKLLGTPLIVMRYSRSLFAEIIFPALVSVSLTSITFDDRRLRGLVLT